MWVSSSVPTHAITNTISPMFSDPFSVPQTLASMRAANCGIICAPAVTV